MASGEFLDEIAVSPAFGAGDEGLWARLVRVVMRRAVRVPRVIRFAPNVDERTGERRFAANVLRNQKYSLLSFVPLVLWNQFKFFFNFFFLAVAASQLVPILKVGFLFTYVAPLAFVLTITMIKEAYDDVNRYRRDNEVNSTPCRRLTRAGIEVLPCAALRVGDLVQVHTKERVPADLVLLRTTNRSGASFVKTDQLDGETDWKVRNAVQHTQALADDADLLAMYAEIYGDRPIQDIYKFVGRFKTQSAAGDTVTEPLGLEQTLWAGTVLASGTVIGAVIYTGQETRAVMNTSQAPSKVGLLDRELNRLSKVLFVMLVLLSLVMVACKGFHGYWYLYFFRFLLLFSSIIPISLRVNLDLAKTWYSFLMMRDANMPNTVVRSSTIPEELGRISFLLTDKTGTLTQNDMVFKRLHLGRVAFSRDSLHEVSDHLTQAYESMRRKHDVRRRNSNSSGELPPMAAPAAAAATATTTTTAPTTTTAAAATSATAAATTDSDELPTSSVSGYGDGVKVRKTIHSRVYDGVLALAVCHNVTPVQDDANNANLVSYQASSPDEVALVKFTESVGLTLVARDFKSITLRNPIGGEEVFDVLQIFPFTSASKRMGIVVRERSTQAISLFVKGADSVLAAMVKYNDWLEEECLNMARDGLRTLVFGRRDLSANEYARWAEKYHAARTSLVEREERCAAVVAELERDLELVALSGVEDKLQHNVRSTLEMLRNASIRIWMLTGDKVETAINIAVSARLVNKGETVHTIAGCKTRDEVKAALQLFAPMRGACLVIDGASLALALEHFEGDFATLATEAPAVVCCRCSPTQKAEVVQLIRRRTGKQTCAIGDGGNDVSMIQAADVGVGIVGKEGKQASLASDFSITQFSFISRLLLWQGRLAYKRSARLGQFVFHRGLVISILQAVFSGVFNWTTISIFNGWLLVGYATAFTCFPVFSLVLDEDVSEMLAFQYPELYGDLQKGRSLSNKTFFSWVLVSIYQGGIICLLCVYLLEYVWDNVVAVAFTSLILAELINVAFEIHRWHRAIVASIAASSTLYVLSMVLLHDTFDMSYILTGTFMWKLAVVTAVACLPVYAIKALRRRLKPPAHEKIQA
jgi:phospholipid-translocating ATPase